MIEIKNKNYDIDLQLQIKLTVRIMTVKLRGRIFYLAMTIVLTRLSTKNRASRFILMMSYGFYLCAFWISTGSSGGPSDHDRAYFLKPWNRSLWLNMTTQALTQVFNLVWIVLKHSEGSSDGLIRTKVIFSKSHYDSGSSHRIYLHGLYQITAF